MKHAVIRRIARPRAGDGGGRIVCWSPSIEQAERLALAMTYGQQRYKAGFSSGPKPRGRRNTALSTSRQQP